MLGNLKKWDGSVTELGKEEWGVQGSRAVQSFGVG